MKRRDFIKLVAAALVARLQLAPQEALASVNFDKLVALSPDLAADIASRFAEDAEDGVPRHVSDPIPMVDVNNNLCGYEVDYSYDETPWGYIVIDASCRGLISRFSLNKGDMGLYNRIIQSPKVSGHRSRYSSDEQILIMLNPFEYGVATGDGSKAYTNSNKELNIKSMGVRSKPVTTWKNLMVPIKEAYSTGYRRVEVAFGAEVSGPSESNIEVNTGSYACAVTALYAIAGGVPYPSANNWQRWLVDTTSQWSEYGVIWDYTNTKIDHISNNIKYGMTTNNDIGPGFVNYCKSRGRDMAYSYTNNPTYEEFKKQAKIGAHSVISVGIMTQGQNGTYESGHSMAADGVCTMGTNEGPTYQYLYVYDGWSDFTFLRFSYSGYTFKGGTYFSI